MATKRAGNGGGHSWPFPLNILQQEWPTVKGAPVSFALGVLACGSLLSLGAYWLVDRFYAAEVRAQAATIQSLTTDRDRLRSITDGKNATSASLKADALVLCKQLRETALAWQVKYSSNSVPWMEEANSFDYRFRIRITRLRDGLDERGYQSEAFERALVELFNINGGYAPSNVFQVASELEKLTSKIAD